MLKEAQDSWHGRLHKNPGHFTRLARAHKITANAHISQACVAVCDSAELW